MTELTLSQRTLQLPRLYPRGFLLVAAVAWWLLYQALSPASEALVAALPVDRASHLGGALQFFLYDTPKVLLPELIVVAMPGDQLVMGAFFHQLPMVDHKDFVIIQHPQYAVGNNDGRLVGQFLVEEIDDGMFGLGIHSGEAIIQDHKFRMLD